jgi:hypothetical protein
MVPCAKADPAIATAANVNSAFFMLGFCCLTKID